MHKDDITEKILESYPKHQPQTQWETIEASAKERAVPARGRTPIRRSSKIIALTAAIALVLVPAAVASAPAILRMLGSEIGFFNSGKVTSSYPPYQELLKKYSTEVGYTAEGTDGFSLTIDNIAADENFISIFYTIRSEKPLLVYFDEYFAAHPSSWYTKYRDQRGGDYVITEMVPILDYSFPELTGAKQEKESSLGEYNNLQSMYSYVEDMCTVKCAQKMLISDDLPETFTIDLFFNGISILDITAPLKDIKIPLTIDRSVTDEQTITYHPENISGIFTGNGGGGESLYIKHNVSVEKVSISPLGSSISFSEKSGSTTMFSNYLLMDDKGNYLYKHNNNFRFRMREDTDKEYRFSDEIYGIDESTRYLKIIPFTYADGLCYDDTTVNENGELYSEIFDAAANIGSLPARLPLTNKTDVIVHNIAIEGNTYKVTYTIEGALHTESFMFEALFKSDANINSCAQSHPHPVYDPITKTFTSEIEVTSFEGDLTEVMRGVKVMYQDITLHEDEAIIVPLEK